LGVKRWNSGREPVSEISRTSLGEKHYRFLLPGKPRANTKKAQTRDKEGEKKLDNKRGESGEGSFVISLFVKASVLVRRTGEISEGRGAAWKD